MVAGPVVSAREEILGRVRSALANSPDSTQAGRFFAEGEAAAGEQANPPDPTGSDSVEIFIQRVAEYRAGVRRVTPDRVAAAIGAICAERKADRLGVPPALDRDWWPLGAAIAVDEELALADLDQLDGALTGCRLAIAESGTIVLDGRGACGRRALTLVPDLHICVIEGAQIVAGVPGALAAIDPTAPLTLVSGPSATSDIELSRVEGVHGPRQLEIVVLERSVSADSGAAQG